MLLMGSGWGLHCGFVWRSGLEVPKHRELMWPPLDGRLDVHWLILLTPECSTGDFAPETESDLFT